MTPDEFQAQLPPPALNYAPTGLPARDGGDFQAKMDPYGVLTPPPSPLGAYDFNALPPGQTPAFLDAVAMNQQPAFPHPASLQPGALNAAHRATDNGVSHAHHSIWIGGPLVDDAGKKAAIMATLEYHKTENPGWSVNLWTDVTRAQLHAAPDDSDVGRFRTWAQTHDINLVNVDEVFGPGAAMTLEGHYKLEENKKGTGYAAASDILRLEALKRFGGIYTDGDDRVKVKFHVAAAGVAADPGVLAATVNASTSNCVFCAVKDSPGVDAMLQRVGENYELSRDEFLARTRLSPVNFANMNDAQKAQAGESNDAPRSEVINRSGPTVAKQILQTDDNRNNIPAGQLEVDTANTSWTNRVPMPGTPDVLQVRASLANPPLPLAQRTLQAGAAAQAALQVPALPADVPLTVEEQAKCALALQKSVTTLAYQLRNEAKLDAAAGAQGVLDLNHATPHLRDLTPAQRLMVTDAIVTTLASPPFQPVAQTVFAVKLPRDVDLPEATLDKLFDTHRFPAVKMDTAAVQDAALRGDARFLEYARQKGQLPALDARAAVFLEAGRFKAMTGGLSIGENQGGRLTLMEAALKGGSQQAVDYLLNQPGADLAVQANPQWATMAGKYGQPRTLLDLASLGSATDHPSAAAGDYSSPSLALLHTTLEANLPADQEATLPALRAEVLDHVITGLNQQNPGSGLRAAGKQLAQHLAKERDFATLAHLHAGGLTMAHVPADQHQGMAAALAENALTPENARVAVQFATSHGPSAADMKVHLAKALVEKAVNREAAEHAIQFATAHGPSAEELFINLGQQAMAGKNAVVLASLLKHAHPDLDHAELQSTAEKDIARTHYPDVEAIKNDYTTAPDKPTASEALTLIHKAIAYTESHLDNAQGGRAARVAGWNQVMDRIKAEHPHNTRIIAAADQAQDRLQVLAQTRTSVRDSLSRGASSLRKSIAERLPGGGGHHAPGGGGVGH